MLNALSRMMMAGVFVILSGCGSGHLNRLNQIDADQTTNFALYRSGQPKEKDLDQWCAMNVRYIFALNAHAGEYEAKLRTKCPTAKVVYNEIQDPDAAISASFLKVFDEQIAQAKSEGAVVLFHCFCGCHRTGRLAAYYRMKHQGWTAEQAIREMNEIGKDMDEHPMLPVQIRAMEDFILGRACSQRSDMCVVPIPDPEVTEAATS